MSKTAAKFQGVDEWVEIPGERAVALMSSIFRAAGCNDGVAQTVAKHLADSSLCGMASHGLMRTIQYVKQFETGYMRPDVEPAVRELPGGGIEVDGNGGIGVPSMLLAVEHGVRIARENGVAALAVRHTGHTGRIGAYAEQIAEQDCVGIILGGGNREAWRQVAPHGGRKALIPTNPYAIGVPGGERGPMVLDFATSKIAGGWIYAAKSAGATLPPDSVIDSDGNPTTDPDGYLDGGAILPAGGAKGYALGLAAELIAEAVLGPTTTECNWLMVVIDATRYRDPADIRCTAEEILREVRNCPPAEGVDTVEVPGERERDLRAAANGVITLPKQTWEQMTALAERLGVSPI